ncbi:MAG: OmpA family protein [Deltaproteobacteria bacterium]|nr:OmpA family protein [Deltaproteobacteria bacterium]
MIASLVIAGDAAADEKLAKTTIETNPADATVQVDGAEQATHAPVTVSLARGRHIVTVTSPDRQTERRAVDAAGAPVTVSIDLIHVPPDGAKHPDAAAAKALVDALSAAVSSAKLRDVSVAVRSGDVVMTLGGVAFESSEIALKSDSATAIADVAGVLKAQTGVRFVVVGHTDNAPFKSDLAHDNSELSLAHALAVARALIAAGIPADDVSADGRGDLEPIASNGTADGKRKNRRIEIIVVPKPSETAEKPKAKTLTADAFKQRMATLTDRAHACYKGTMANVMVKLTVAPSGQITKSTVLPPFAGKPEGDCVAGLVKDVTFDAWDGQTQTYSFSFLLSD